MVSPFTRHCKARTAIRLCRCMCALVFLGPAMMRQQESAMRETELKFPAIWTRLRNRLCTNGSALPFDVDKYWDWKGSKLDEGSEVILSFWWCGIAPDVALQGTWFCKDCVDASGIVMHLVGIFQGDLSGDVSDQHCPPWEGSAPVLDTSRQKGAKCCPRYLGVAPTQTSVYLLL